MDTENPPRAYRVETAAALLDLEVEGLRDRVRRGQIPHSRLGRTILIPASFVERLARPEAPAVKKQGERVSIEVRGQVSHTGYPPQPFAVLTLHGPTHHQDIFMNLRRQDLDTIIEQATLARELLAELAPSREA